LSPWQHMRLRVLHCRRLTVQLPFSRFRPYAYMRRQSTYFQCLITLLVLWNC
jgi:hypothetical protein